MSANKYRPNPAISCLGFTAKEKFPLLLVFGRESNNELKPENYVGKYCFRDSPRSAFWNRTYGLLARIYKTDSFKNDCRKVNLSPVIFSNVHHRPILNNDNEKNKKRLETETTYYAEIKEYIKYIFDHEIISRVRLVILSGVKDRADFSESTKLIEEVCKKKHIPLKYLRYMASWQIKYDEQLDHSLRDKSNHIVQTFYDTIQIK